MTATRTADTIANSMESNGTTWALAPWPAQLASTSARMRAIRSLVLNTPANVTAAPRSPSSLAALAATWLVPVLQTKLVVAPIGSLSAPASPRTLVPMGGTR